MSGLVENSQRHVLSCRGSYKFDLLFNSSNNRLSKKYKYFHTRYTEIIPIIYIIFVLPRNKLLSHNCFFHLCLYTLYFPGIRLRLYVTCTLVDIIVYCSHMSRKWPEMFMLNKIFVLFCSVLFSGQNLQLAVNRYAHCRK